MTAFLYCDGPMSRRVDAVSRRDLCLILTKHRPGWRRIPGVRIKRIRFTKSCMYDREFRRRLSRHRADDRRRAALGEG